MSKKLPVDSGASRRDFMKTSTAAVVGGSLLGGLNIAQSAHAAGDDTIKIALIGCGGRGTGAASQALHTKGSVKLIAVADAFADRANGALGNLKKEFGADRVDVPADRVFVGFDAYQKAIAAGPDLVVLATPPGFRPIHFQAAVAAGKHVFMEKPVATDAPGIRKVLAAAEEAKKKNLCVGVGLQRRHQGPYLETVKRIHDGAIGDVLAMRVYWNGSKPWVRDREPGWTEMEYQMRNWYYFNWLCGDHIVEQHIHNLDVAAWVKGGYPIKANGMGGCEVRKGNKYGEIFDHHAVEFEYADGSRVFSQCRHIEGCWSSVSEYAHGTKGFADVSGHRITLNGKQAEGIKGAGGNPYQVEHDDLFAAIRAGKQYNEAEFGAKSTFMAILGRYATYSGKVVDWKEALEKGLDLQPKEYSFQATPQVMPRPDGSYALAVPGTTKVLG